MSILSIHHINVRVATRELLALREFYCDVLGLTEGWRPPFSSHGYWLYADGQPIVHLVERLPGEATLSNTAGPIDHVALGCTNLDETLARLNERGVKFSVTQVPIAGDTQIFFRDPVGTGIELTFPKADDTQSPTVSSGS